MLIRIKRTLIRITQPIVYTPIELSVTGYALPRYSTYKQTSLILSFFLFAYWISIGVVNVWLTLFIVNNNATRVFTV